MNAASMTTAEHIRVLAFRWHRFVARSRLVSWTYVFVVSSIARHIPNRHLRNLLEWLITGQQVPWRPLGFDARTVLLGESTPVRLRPHLGEFDQAALFRKHLTYEASVFAWLERYATQRYDAVVEIGANVGIYSVFFDALIRRNPAGRLRRVYAFEPSGEAYLRLLANLRENHAQSVEPFCVAVSDATGFSPFYEPEGHLTNGSLSRGFANMFAPKIREQLVVTIAAAQLGDLFAKHQRVLLKIDAEGAEPHILAAMRSVLDRYRPDLLIEVLKGTDAELGSLDALESYVPFLITDKGPSRREALVADLQFRDWLLSDAPLQLDGLNP